MNYPSRSSLDREVELFLAAIGDGAYESRRDGCEVVLVQCQECSRMFEDEVESFKASVIARKAVLCLSCDDTAIAPSFSGVTIQVGWFMG